MTPDVASRRSALVTVSVVIPIKDGRAYLGDALRTALGQEGVNVECIVVDDGSRDHPEEIIDELSPTSGAAVTFIKNVTNRGRSYSRNVGAAAASGDVLAFLDADDRYRPGHLKGVAEALADHPGCIYTFPAFIDHAGTPCVAGNVLRGSPEELVIAGRIPYTSGIALSRVCWGQLGGFDCYLEEREDWDLFLRALRNGVALALDERRTVEVRRHEGNNSANSERFLRNTFIVARRAAHVATLMPPRTAQAAVAQMHLGIAEACSSRPCGWADKLAGIASGLAAVRTNPALVTNREWLMPMAKLLLPMDMYRRCRRRSGAYAARD